MGQNVIKLDWLPIEEAFGFWAIKGLFSKRSPEKAVSGIIRGQNQMKNGRIGPSDWKNRKKPCNPSSGLCQVSLKNCLLMCQKHKYQTMV